MMKIIGIGGAALVSLAILAMTVRAEFLNDYSRYPALLGAALILASVIGIIRDRGNRPTIEG